MVVQASAFLSGALGESFLVLGTGFPCARAAVGRTAPLCNFVQRRSTLEKGH